MPLEVIGRGLLGRTFASAPQEAVADAIVCASGVPDSACNDESAFRRERDLLVDHTERARARGAVVVYFSGAPVYGSTSGPRVETAEAIPETAYGHHKLDCERLVVNGGAPYLVLRLPNVVGPIGHPNQLIPSLVSQALRGSILTKSGATRDLLDVDDLVIIVGALLRSSVRNSILNVASGISTPVPRLVAVIAETLGTSPLVLSSTGGDDQEFSTAKVRGLLPEYPRFGADYPYDVLRRRVPAIARALMEAATP